MPDYTDIVTQVLAFTADYVWAIAAGVVIGLIAWGGKRILKMGK